jgi:hypothetical protein
MDDPRGLTEEQERALKAALLGAILGAILVMLSRRRA